MFNFDMLTKSLKGKRGIVMGLANKMSIAYGIAQALVENGAEVILTYQGDIIHKRIVPIAEELQIKHIIECDVSSDANIKKTFDDLHSQVGNVDFLVHSIAYSDKNQLRGYYYNTTRENFAQTMDISCYSFVAVCKHISPFLNEGGSLLTLSYYGAEKHVPRYNVMGVAKAALEASVRYLAVDFGTRAVRVNAISAGPVKTLAAAGIGDFKLIFNWVQENSPLKRNVTIEEIGSTAAFLLSPLASGITGEVVHVDCGYNITGTKRLENEHDETAH